MKKRLFLYFCLMILLSVAFSGCARKKNAQPADVPLISARPDSVVLGQSVASGQAFSTVDKGMPVEVVIGSPYMSAIGEECFEAKVYSGNAEGAQLRSVCHRDGVWALLPEIVIHMPHYNSPTRQVQ